MDPVSRLCRATLSQFSQSDDMPGNNKLPVVIIQRIDTLLEGRLVFKFDMMGLMLCLAGFSDILTRCPGKDRYTYVDAFPVDQEHLVVRVFKMRTDKKAIAPWLSI